MNKNLQAELALIDAEHRVRQREEQFTSLLMKITVGILICVPFGLLFLGGSQQATAIPAKPPVVLTKIVPVMSSRLVFPLPDAAPVKPVPARVVKKTAKPKRLAKTVARKPVRTATKTVAQKIAALELPKWPKRPKPGFEAIGTGMDGGTLYWNERTGGMYVE